MLRLGLKGKFFLYSNILIVATMTVVTLMWISYERSSHLDAIERRGRSIVEVMAIPITDALMYEEIGFVSELGLIDDLIGEVRTGNLDLVRYVAVSNPDGVVTHSTRWQLLGKPFPAGPAWTRPGDGPSTRLLTNVEGEHIVEVKAPLAISTRTWGEVVVGFSLASIGERVRVVTRYGFILATVMILANSAITAVYVQWLFAPVLQLNQSMKRAAQEGLNVRASERRGDEVGELACSFNMMRHELAEARDRDRMRQAQLIHTEKMVAMGTLAAGVAHEINNPLAGILGCVENMRNNPDDRDMAERYLVLIKDGLERIQRTVSNLLDFSRPRELTLEVIPLNHCLEHVLELITYQLNQGHIRVEKHLASDDEVLVKADHFHLEQVFLNLMLNAIRAMPDGGLLSLKSWRRRGIVLAEVADTGVGIAPDDRSRIFNPFFTTHEVGQGTGLGLTVVASIVAAHAAEIEVDSKVGEGSTFRLMFKPASAERRVTSDGV